ncbi:murein L,D-transpeptidase [Labedella gwakjiensis]|nr:murein L,D-transpeptidase [Labedella gwakjiensis]
MVAVVAIVAVVVVVRFLGSDAEPRPVARSATPTPMQTPTPTPTGHALDDRGYDLAGLPTVDVFAVIPALPVDDDPEGGTTGEVARPVPAGAPVFAEPGEEPVAALPYSLPYEGSIVPIIERERHWVRVLLVGRSGLPSEGTSGQLTGWLRAADVQISPLDTTIEVSISAGTIDIVTASGRERVPGEFAWGTEATPTPIGRTFVMMVRTASSLAYTRGHPIVYLAVQSSTLDGFGGIDVAITAFHYHDTHTGQISNGCIRVGTDAINRLTQVPPGTTVRVLP